MKEETPCSVDGCNSVAVKRGWCDMHYRRWQKHGDPLYIKSRFKNRKCSIEGCNKPHYSLGYCLAHYWRFKEHGDPLAPRKKRARKQRAICSIDGCEREVLQHGYCNTHLLRWKRHGDPLYAPARKANSGSFPKGLTPHNKGVPMTPEQRAQSSEAHKGLPAWNKGVPMRESTKAKFVGIKRSEETKAKIREKRAEQVFTEETRRKMSEARKGKPITPEAIAKLSGPNNYHWKGGTVRNLSRRTWRKLRAQVLERDGNACRACGKTGRLIAHHVIYFDEGGPDSIENLITLCQSCHTEVHRHDHLRAPSLPK